MNLEALPVTRPTYVTEIHFARHQGNSQRSTLVVVISGDGELLTSVPNSVAGEMLSVRTGFIVTHSSTIPAMKMRLFYISFSINS